MPLGFAAAAKDAPIITPLMDFVRQKRASKGATRVSFPFWVLGGLGGGFVWGLGGEAAG